MVKLFDPATSNDATEAPLPPATHWVGAEVIVDNPTDYTDESSAFDAVTSAGNPVTTAARALASALFHPRNSALRRRSREITGRELRGRLLRTLRQSSIPSDAFCRACGGSLLVAPEAPPAADQFPIFQRHPPWRLP